jgi:hypothetical protein
VIALCFFALLSASGIRVFFVSSFFFLWTAFFVAFTETVSPSHNIGVLWEAFTAFLVAWAVALKVGTNRFDTLGLIIVDDRAKFLEECLLFIGDRLLAWWGWLVKHVGSLVAELAKSFTDLSGGWGVLWSCTSSGNLEPSFLLDGLASGLLGDLSDWLLGNLLDGLLFEDAESLSGVGIIFIFFLFIFFFTLMAVVVGFFHTVTPFTEVLGIVTVVDAFIEASDVFGDDCSALLLVFLIHFAWAVVFAFVVVVVSLILSDLFRLLAALLVILAVVLVVSFTLSLGFLTDAFSGWGWRILSLD